MDKKHKRERQKRKEYHMRRMASNKTVNKLGMMYFRKGGFLG